MPCGYRVLHINEIEELRGPSAVGTGLSYHANLGVLETASERELVRSDVKIIRVHPESGKSAQLLVGVEPSTIAFKL